MADYTIQNSNKDKTYTIPSKQFNNTDTDLIFIGENTLKYGTALQQDILNLLTNFYALTPEFFNQTSIDFVKSRAIPGQLIYDGTDLLLCTEHNTFEKISLSPIKPSLKFITDTHPFIEDSLINGKISGYVQVVSEGITFKKNIESLINILEITNIKNANNTSITINPIISYISPNSIAITISNIITPNDANINQGEIKIKDDAFNYVPPLEFNKSYKFSENPIKMFPEIPTFKFPNDLTTLDKFQTLEYIKIKNHHMFINLYGGSTFNDGFYFIVNENNKVTDVNNLFNVSELSNTTFFNGQLNENNNPYSKPKLIVYKDTLATILTNNTDSKNILMEFNLDLDGRLIKKGTRNILPTFASNDVRIVKLLSENILYMNVDKTISIGNLSNNAVEDYKFFQNDVDDPLTVYNLIDVVDCNNVRYFIWALDDKVTITDKSMVRLFDDVDIIPSSRYKDSLNNNPYSLVYSNNKDYIIFPSKDSSNLRLTIFKVADKSVNHYVIDSLSKFNSDLRIDDLILSDDNNCIMVTNGPKVMKIDVNVSGLSKTINELYNVNEGVIILSDYAKSLFMINPSEIINIVKVFAGNLLNIF